MIVCTLVFATIPPPPPYFVEIHAGVCTEWRSCSTLNVDACCPDASGEFDSCCCLETDMLVNVDYDKWNSRRVSDGSQGICCQKEAIQTSIEVTTGPTREFDIYCKTTEEITVNNSSRQWWEGDNFLITVIAGSIVLVLVVAILYFLFKELTPEQVNSITGLVTAIGGVVTETKKSKKEITNFLPTKNTNVINPVPEEKPNKPKLLSTTNVLPAKINPLPEDNKPKLLFTQQFNDNVLNDIQQIDRNRKKNIELVV